MKYQHGLTLIEVMVALLIFGLTGTAILKAVGDNLSAVSELRSITYATQVANNQLTRISLQKSWPIKNNIKGEMEMGTRTWYWQQQVEKTQAADMVQVRILVSEDATFSSTITDVTTFFGKPGKAL